MTIRIIVPAHNNAATLGACLRSLRAQRTSLGLEVVVLDDGSTDATLAVAEAVATDWPALKVLRHPRRRGAAAARNTAIRSSPPQPGELLVLLDADHEAPPEWLTHLLAPLLNGVAELVGGPDRVPAGNPLLARCIGYSMDSPLASGGLRWGRPRLVDYAPGTGNTALSRSLFEESGGLDERFHDTGEDSEWMHRLRPLLSTPARFVPEGQVWHHRITSPRRFFGKMYRCGQRRVDIWWLWPEAFRWPHVAPLVLVLGMAALALSRPYWLAAGMTLWLGSDALLGALRLGDPRALAVLPVTSLTVGTAYGCGILQRLLQRALRG